MAYKITKTEVANMLSEKLIDAYEDCITTGVYEHIARGVVTKATTQSRELMQEELLIRLRGLK